MPTRHFLNCNSFAILDVGAHFLSNMFASSACGKSRHPILLRQARLPLGQVDIYSFTLMVTSLPNHISQWNQVKMVSFRAMTAEETAKHNDPNYNSDDDLPPQQESD